LPSGKFGFDADEEVTVDAESQAARDFGTRAVGADDETRGQA
jgi:hypothetical protein